MTKQRNPVARNNFNKGSAHRDRSKSIPREDKYQKSIALAEEWLNGVSDDKFLEEYEAIENERILWYKGADTDIQGEEKL